MSKAPQLRRNPIQWVGLRRGLRRPIMPPDCNPIQFIDALGYNSRTRSRQVLDIRINTQPDLNKELMDQAKLDHFRSLLVAELRRHTEYIREDQSAALEFSDDGVKDSVDLSLMDVNKELVLRLGERASQMVADIDQALLRIREGSYGICAACGKPIDERRLNAVPTARYDANCQAALEQADGTENHSTL